MAYRATGNEAVDKQTRLIISIEKAEEDNRAVQKILFTARMEAQDALRALCLKEGVDYPYVPEKRG